MTERRGILNEIARLKTEAQELFRRADVARISGEAKELAIANLEAVLQLTARKPKETPCPLVK